MNAHHRADEQPRGWRRVALWLLLWAPGLLVAIGAGVATAHGLFEVAAAAGVPGGLAWLYPVITDGLALVAYVSTARLADGNRTYAWTVVVICAGLSGVAQAAYLADGVGTASTALRFGVGAWPAIAAAIVAHLLFLLGHHRTATEHAVESVVRAAAGDEQPVQPSERPESVPVQTDPSNTAVQQTVQPAEPVGVQPLAMSNPEPSNAARPGGGGGGGAGQRERARAAARRHAAHHGDLPSVRELERLADVSRGSAHNALKELREQPRQLQIVTDDEDVINQ